MKIGSLKISSKYFDYYCNKIQLTFRCNKFKKRYANKESWLAQTCKSMEIQISLVYNTCTLKTVQNSEYSNKDFINHILLIQTSEV